MSGGVGGGRSASASSAWRGKIEGVADAAAERAADRVAVGLTAALPGVEVARERGRVVISGRGLSRRWFDMPALRWVAGVLR